MGPFFVFLGHHNNADQLSTGTAVLRIQSPLGDGFARYCMSLFNDDVDLGNQILARRAFEVERACLSEYEFKIDLFGVC